MTQPNDQPEMARVEWYEHNCPWWSKYCDENHRRTAWVPMSVVKQYEVKKE